MKRATVLLLLLAIMLVVVPASAAEGNFTTQLNVTKLAIDNSVIDQRTVDIAWMEEYLPIYGDGVTHYYHQGPVFINNDDPALQEELRWNELENINVLEKLDGGAIQGSSVRDLCDLVGGMSPGDEIEITDVKGFAKYFNYTNVYNPQPRQGEMIIAWKTDFTDDTDPANNVYPGEVFDTGMRFFFLADDSVNPFHKHCFGNWDMHETLDESYWYFYDDQYGSYPSASGLSVKYVSDLIIYTDEEPVSTVDVLFDGTVILEEGTTFDWTDDYGNVETIDTLTPHGALEAAAAEGGFTYGGEWKSFKNTALLNWIDDGVENYTYDDLAGLTWNYQLNGTYQNYFSDSTGISNNAIQDGDYIEFYYGPDEETTENATAVVRIQVSTIPASDVDVLFDGSVILEEGTTFDWTDDYGNVVAIDSLTPHGALEAAAAEGGFTYGGEWKSFKNTALLNWIDDGVENYTYDDLAGLTWNYRLNGTYQNYFSDTTGISNNAIQDGDYIEFYYGPDEETTENATAVVRIQVSTIPASDVDVLYDGPVTLTPDATFDVTAYDSSVTYIVNETTPLGALEMAASAGGFTYRVTDSRWEYDQVLLLDDVDIYLYQNPGKWYAYVNGVFKDGYKNHAAGLNVIELVEGDIVEFYYASDVVDKNDLAEVQGKATAAVKTYVAFPLPYDILYEGTVILEENTTFEWTDDYGNVEIIDSLTPHGALEAAAAEGGFTYGGEWKSFKNTALLNWIDDGVENYTYDDLAGLTWNYRLNGTYQNYFSDTTGISNNVIQNGDYIEFYYGPDEETLDNATVVIRITVSNGQVPDDWTLELSGALDTAVSKAYFEDGLACEHSVEWTDDYGNVWGGIPLWLFVGMVDDDPDVGYAHFNFNDALAAEDYEIKVIASDGWFTILHSTDIARNDGYIVANTLNGTELPYGGEKPSWPLHLKGPEVDGGQQVGGIVRIELSGLPEPPEGWTIEMVGEVGDVITQSEFEEGIACVHSVEWTDGDGATWSGAPLWVLLGAIDDYETTEHPNFNDTVAASGYTIKVSASDGSNCTFTSADVARNDDYIVANKLNGTELDGDAFPLKLKGPELSGGQQVGNIVKIEILELQTPPAEEGSWNLNLAGKITDVISEAEFQAALDCPGSGHNVTWTQEITDNGTVIETHEWSGIPLWFFAGWVDDRIPHDYNVAQASAGYTITVKAADGYSYSFPSADVAWSNDYIVANMMDGAPLSSEGDKAPWPLRLVGDGVAKSSGSLGGMSIGSIAEIELTEFGEPTGVPELHIVKFAEDRQNITAEIWIDYTEMMTQFEVIGDGQTMYSYQAVTMDPEDPWGIDNDTKGGTKISNAVKGTRLSDLVGLVGGMGEDTELILVASDGRKQALPYSSIYPTAEIYEHQGDAILAWYADGEFVPAYGDGMRNFFTPADHIFGQWDMHEALPMEYWHYYYQTYTNEYAPGVLYPSCAGTSNKYVTEIYVYTVPESMWYLDLDGSGIGGIEHNISKGFFEQALSCQFGANHEQSYTDDEDHVWTGMPLWFLAGFVDDEDMHSDNAFNDNLALEGYDIVITASDGYSVTLNSQDVIRSNDYIVANSLDGIHLTTDDGWPLRLVGPNLTRKQSISEIAQIELISNTFQSFEVSDAWIEYSKSAGSDALSLDAVFVLPEGRTADLMTDAVAIDLDGYLVEIPVGEFKEKKGVYTYQSPSETEPSVQVKISLVDGTLDVFMEKADFSAFTFDDGIDAGLKIGTMKGYANMRMYSQRYTFPSPR